MFQRLKGAIDSRIAEEQARQRQATQAAQTRPPPRRRPQNPNAIPRRPTSRPRDGTPTSGERQPDPADFVIGDDEGSATPAVEKPDPLAKQDEGEGQKPESTSETQPVQPEASGENGEEKSAETSTPATPADQPVELPADVKVKLRKLEKLEVRYGELLRAYRAAHAKVQTIEPFEASLRENTPLTSINDPPALVEYLNQVKLKGDMVLDELKRVTGDRDDYKKQAEKSEKETATLKAEVEDLKAQVAKAESLNTVSAEEKPEDNSESKARDAEDTNGTDTTAKSPPPSRLGSLSLFSPKFGATKEPAKETSEEFFSYDSEIPRMEQELQERTEEVAQLTKQVTSLKADLAVARESTSSMVQTLESASQELNSLRDEKDKFESTKTELQNRITELEKSANTSSEHTDDLKKQLEDVKGQKDEAVAEIDKLKVQIAEVEKAKSDIEVKLETQIKNTEIINEKLAQKDHITKDLEDSLAVAKAAEREQAKRSESEKSSEKKLATMQGIMDNVRAQLNTAENTVAELKQAIQAKQDEFASKPSSKIFGFLDERNDPKLNNLKSQNDVVDYLAENFGLRKNTPSSNITPPASTPAQSTISAPSEPASSTVGGKKKNKKKKKGGKSAQTATDEAEPDTPVKVSEDLNDMGDDGPPTASTNTANATIAALEQEVAELKKEVEAKSASIDRLSSKLKDQESLQEEIETLRDDLLHQGEEHVEARDKLKEAVEAKKSLENTVEKLESELADLRKQIVSHAALKKTHQEKVVEHDELQKSHREKSAQHEELVTKSDTLQKDLNASESLAASRFKDISDLKELLSKAQPELRQLRSELAELKSAKDDLKNKEGDLKRLESRHEDLKSEMKGLSKRLGDKDSEIKELQTKIEQETKARNKVENELSSAHLDARVAENKRKDTSELLEQRQKDLTQSKEEAANLRKKVYDLEDKVGNQTKEISSLKEEITLKTALHSSSQSLLQSLRDQTHELSMQARESSSRADSLEEELAETQRMLSERTNQSQTMRLLLDQSQNGVEARILEMKERMEAAIDERDRIEDEANVRDRRLMREVEDARNKMRDAQKQLKGLEDERDELETKNRDWKRRREELEQQALDAKKDVEDVKQAMKSLRDALDESERQVREVETQKADLRRQIDETNDRLEKLTKSNKSLSEEIKSLQQGPRKGSLRPAGEHLPRSSRPSLETARSPAPPLVREQSGSTPRSGTPTDSRNNSVGLSQGTVDYVYLKNVLLQFMEQKDKSHQRQLVPVLAMLLHFDRKDEQKWMAAISAK